MADRPHRTTDVHWYMAVPQGDGWVIVDEPNDRAVVGEFEDRESARECADVWNSEEQLRRYA